YGPRIRGCPGATRRAVRRVPGRGSRFGERPAHDAAVLGAEVTVGHVEEPAGVGGEQALEVEVEVFEIEERQGEPHGEGLLVDLFMAEDPVGDGDLPAALHLLLVRR